MYFIIFFYHTIIVIKFKVLYKLQKHTRTDSNKKVRSDKKINHSAYRFAYHGHLDRVVLDTSKCVLFPFPNQ